MKTTNFISQETLGYKQMKLIHKINLFRLLKKKN